MNENNNIKKIAPAILKEIQKAESVLLSLHIRPDPDCCGSALAMAHVLEGMGKDVTVISGDSAFPESFYVFPGADKIEHKHLGEVDLDNLDLYMIVDHASIQQISKKAEVVFPNTLRTANIDHHSTNQNFADITLVVDHSSSTAEIMYDLFKEWEVAITKNVAVNLLAGMYYDTKSLVALRSPESASATVQKFAELVQIAPNYYETLFNFKTSRDKHTVITEGLVVGNTKEYLSGKVAIGTASLKQLKEHGVNTEVVGKMRGSSIMQKVKDWMIAVAIIEKTPGLVDISMRSKEGYDVAVIAKTFEDGGGHAHAAASRFNGTVEEARDVILEKIKKQYPELEK